MVAIGTLFGAVDAFFDGIRRGARGAVRAFWDGPLQVLLLGLIIGVVGAVVLAEGLGRRLDRAAGWLERAVLFVAMLGMTFLAFNEYLVRELKPLLNTDLGGLWALEGQMNLALLLMVVVGFLGASIATQERKHLTVDAIERVLSPGPARFVKRLTALVAALLCWAFAQGAWEKVFTSSHDAFEGVKTWGWMVAPVNALTSLLPGHKYGPGTPWRDQGAWEDAMYDQGMEWGALPDAFFYVEAGSRFPMWLPVALLGFAFAMMSLRFGAQVLYPAPVANPPKRKSGGRGPADVVLAGAFPGALIAIGVGAWLGQGWLILLASVLLVFLGAPLFVAVGVGTLGAWVFLRDGSAATVVDDMFEATRKQELLAIPFFVLAGNLMTNGSIAARLIAFARALLGRLPGGLGVGAVLSCALFAAISGSSPVTVIAIGSIIFPMLLKDGYSEDYSIGVLTTAGGLGIIIPPSIPMIVYAIIVSSVPGVGAIDPAVLFKAGILPGLFIAAMLIVYTLYVTWPRGGRAVPIAPDLDQPYVANVARSFARGFLSLMLPVLILGGIYGWIDLAPLGIDFALRFTVTEAAAVAVVYALVVELFIHRELTFGQLPKVISESALMMGTLFLILVIAISLNRFFVFEQVPEMATEWMLARVDSPLAFLLIVNLFLLALGCVMDILSAILIVAPLLAPIAAGYGINPIHFGIMFIVNLELGYLTPPMGINLFVASTVFERPILSVIKAVLPFLIVMLFCLSVIVWFPWLSLALIDAGGP